MKQTLTIIGAGGFGREVRSMLSDLGFAFQGFIDDASAEVSETIQTLQHTSISESAYHIAIGDSKVRESVYNRLPKNLHYPTLIHSRALLQDPKSIALGKGSVICAGSILTCDIRLGNFCLINLHCTVGHDVIMEDFCSLMPSVNLGGAVYLEKGVYIGTGATVLPGVRIGAYTTIGAGAVVTRDIASGTVVKGVPAK
jgi:sugar O-acyltransferase (sialic acid O-acetyltransferase NeuD family)